MNDEIKLSKNEIIGICEFLKIHHFENSYLLLDYITNLQEKLRIRDTNWQSLKYYLEKLYDRDYIEEEIFDDICNRVNELESQIEIKSYQKEITNLQQENERLNTELNGYKDEFCNDTIKEYELVMEQEYYKSRCEKAIDYIMSDLITEWDIKNDGCVSGSDLPADAITPLLNILNGGDE